MVAVKALTAGNRCLDDEDVQGFVEGTLINTRWERVNQHIASCDDCRSLVAETAKLFANQSQLTVALRRSKRSPNTNVAAGQTIGRYVVERVLGAGGMGVVYLAHDGELHRKVALKLLRPDPQSDERLEEARSRLLREAQAMARVSHPNVVTIHDVGRFEEQVFLAMEFVSGATLHAYVRARERSWREVTELCLQAGRGLAAAHAANLVHRDFKPANVLIGDDGRVRVTDFGLAFMSSAPQPAPTPTHDPGTPPLLSVTLTRTGLLLGTPAYASPEQLRGVGADARSDQFSFCVTLYQALYRRHPFHDEFAAMMWAVHRNEVQPPPPGTKVPGGLFKILCRGLRADPEERYPRMDVLLDELSAVLAATETEIVLPARRFKRFAIAAGVAVAVIALALFVVMHFTSEPSSTPAAMHAPTISVPPVPSPDPNIAPVVRAPAPPDAAPIAAAPPPRNVTSKRPVRPRTKTKVAKPAPSPPKVDSDALKPLRDDK